MGVIVKRCMGAERKVCQVATEQNQKEQATRPTSSVKSGHCHHAIQRSETPKLVGKKGNRSGDDGGRKVSSDTDHCQSCVLQFLHGHILLLCVGHLSPVARPVETGLLVDFTREGLSFHLSSVLDSLDDGAEDNELGPPLVIGSKESLDGVGGCYRSLKGPELWKDPPDSGEHGRSSVRKLGLAKVIDGCPLGQFEWVKLKRKAKYCKRTDIA